MSAIQPISPDRFDSPMAASARPIACPNYRACRMTAAILTTAIISAFISIEASTPAQAAPPDIDLSRQQPGTPPKDFQFWRDGRDDPGHWSVVRDPTAADGFSMQGGNADKTTHSALAIYGSLSIANAKVRVHFKLVDGTMPSAGIAMRVTSPDDYYLVRASAFEERLSFMHVVHGVFEEIAAVDADISRDHWQTLEVAATEDRFTISLDDVWVLTAFDRNAAARGKFALWTEKDGVTRFDQLQIAPLANTAEPVPSQ
jgi:hypothetical protein